MQTAAGSSCRSIEWNPGRMASLGGGCRSKSHPYDGAWRHSGEMVLLAILSGQLVAIGPGWTTFDVPMMVASLARCGEPGPIICHRPFHREDAAVEVGHYQVEGLVVRH